MARSVHRALTVNHADHETQTGLTAQNSVLSRSNTGGNHVDVGIHCSPGGVTELFARNWRTLALRGLLAIVLGVLVFARPFVTLTVVMLAFAIYCLIDGVSGLFAAITGWRHRENRWLLLLEGVVGVAPSPNRPAQNPRSYSYSASLSQ